MPLQRESADSCFHHDLELPRSAGSLCCVQCDICALIVASDDHFLNPLAGPNMFVFYSTNSMNHLQAQIFVARFAHLQPNAFHATWSVGGRFHSSTTAFGFAAAIR